MELASQTEVHSSRGRAIIALTMSEGHISAFLHVWSLQERNSDESLYNVQNYPFVKLKS